MSVMEIEDIKTLYKERKFAHSWTQWTWPIAIQYNTIQQAAHVLWSLAGSKHFMMTHKPSQINLFLVCDQSSSVGLWMQ